MIQHMLINHKPAKVVCELFDSSFYHVIFENNNIVLNKTEVEKENILLEHKVLLNHWLVSFVEKKLKFNHLCNKPKYIVLTVHWGEESYENVSLSIKVIDEELVKEKLKKFVLKFKDNGYIKNINQLRDINEFFIKEGINQFVFGISVSIGYYPSHYEFSVQVYDGIHIELKETLKEEFPFS